MPELEEGTFDRQKKNEAGSVNQHFDEEKGRDGRERDVVLGAELDNEMDYELVTEVNAVSDAGEECSGGNFDATER
jgi:hypothetical protein